MSRKDRKLKEKESRNKSYLSYYDAMRASNKQPMTRYHWEKSGRRRGYMGAKGGTTALAKLTRKERKAVGLPD